MDFLFTDLIFKHTMKSFIANKLQLIIPRAKLPFDMSKSQQSDRVHFEFFEILRQSSNFPGFKPNFRFKNLSRLKQISNIGIVQS